MYPHMQMPNRITNQMPVPTRNSTPTLIQNPYFVPMVNSAPRPISVVPIGYSPNRLYGSLCSPSTASNRSIDSIGFGEEDNFVKKVNVAQLNVRMFTTSLRTNLEWPIPITKRPVMFLVEFVVNNGHKVTTRIKRNINPSNLVQYFIKTVPGYDYFVRIECRSLDEKFLVAEWSKEFRAEMSIDEFNTLYAKCIVFLKKFRHFYDMQEFQRIYRCKPVEYWDQIYYYSNDIMQKYIKDPNGQPGNRINGKLKGLFFSANVDYAGRMPNTSYFGNVRMDCDAFLFLNPNSHNFYFADFYCNTNKHYATIVICVMNSDSDKYCEEKLIKLDPFHNPFIKLVAPKDKNSSWRFYHSKILIIELFYTDDISLKVGIFNEITPSGAGRSRTYGVPNNKECIHCNLYPIRRNYNKL